MLIVLLGFAILVLLSPLVIDTVWRRRLTAETHIEIERGLTSSDTLIVYLPGILASARTSSIDLINVWRLHGDVMLVEYGNERFIGPRCVQVVAEVICRQNVTKTYHHISFIGASMGGLLAYDIIQKLALGNIASIDLIVLDAPTSNNDFQGYRRLIAPLLLVLLFGPIWNRFNLIARVSDHSKEFKLSFWRDQLTYIMSHGAPKSDSLKGLVNRLVYIRSTRDHDIVNKEASLIWLATMSNSMIMEVDSTHVGFAECPETWRSAFERIYDVKRDRVN